MCASFGREVVVIGGSCGTDTILLFDRPEIMLATESINSSASSFGFDFSLTIYIERRYRIRFIEMTINDSKMIIAENIKFSCFVNHSLNFA